MGTSIQRRPRAYPRGGLLAALLLGAMTGCGLPCLGQSSPGSQLASAVIGGGSATASSDGEHLLSATVGQAVVTTAGDGGWSLSSGFWPVVQAASPAEGAVTCALLPGAALDRGAKWRLTTGPDTGWQVSGATVTGLPVTGNPYTVTFRALADWTSPADQSVAVVAGGTTAVEGTYALRTYTLAYLAGAGGSVTGPSPQTVDHGGAGAAVSATPATGYHFLRWSDGSTDNPRQDMGVTADLTVTAEFAVNVYTVTFLAEAGGSITGSAVQTVNHGGTTTPVTAMPSYAFVFGQWDDGSTANPRVLAAVTASQTVVAQFRAAGAVLPEGPFVVPVSADGVAAGRGLWDLTGAYATTVKGDSLTMDLVHDTKGKVRGTAVYTLAKAGAVTVPIKGSAKGSGGVLAVKLSLKGASPDRSAAIALVLDLTLNAAARQLEGSLAGSVTVGDTRTPVLAHLVLGIPAPMDGTWALALALAQGPNGIAGTARLTLANGADYDYVAKGRQAGQTAALSLAGAPADPAAKGIRMKVTVTPLEGGWARLEGFSGKGYGQTIRW